MFKEYENLFPYQSEEKMQFISETDEYKDITRFLENDYEKLEQQIQSDIKVAEEPFISKKPKAKAAKSRRRSIMMQGDAERDQSIE